jgi:hypothetical protein
VVFGNEKDGVGVDVRRTVTGSARPPVTVTLDLQVGYGEVEVRHAAA